MLFTKKHLKQIVNVTKCQKYTFHVYLTCVQKSNLNLDWLICRLEISLARLSAYETA